MLTQREGEEKLEEEKEDGRGKKRRRKAISPKKLGHEEEKDFGEGLKRKGKEEGCWCWP